MIRLSRHEFDLSQPHTAPLDDNDVLLHQQVPLHWVYLGFSSSNSFPCVWAASLSEAFCIMLACIRVIKHGVFLNAYFGCDR